ncbi:SCPU domain-containing protein [Aliidiomarina soli]|uniref:SCPU domain-containing protein n=2 Tax=Aliidiomarina soli TaxID=1928574 RepID=A0A432WE78_9GAMM|nr:SCPU domain-containing protein [Aliidiomarina soli]
MVLIKVPTMTTTQRTALASLACLLVSAPALADCTISAEGLSFGQYDVFDESPTEGVGNLTVSCTPSTSYTVLLSAGTGSYTERYLTGDQSTLIYNLYIDAAYSQVWGDGSGVSTVVSGTTDGATNHDLYGRIPARQNVTPGFYTDTITVTVEF